MGRLLLGFALVWVFFYAVFREFPYLSSGAEVCYRSKVSLELKGSVFPARTHSLRVLIFGDSRILDGFVPEYFDGLASADRGMEKAPGQSDYHRELDERC
jgi:hypothetical protein